VFTRVEGDDDFYRRAQGGGLLPCAPRQCHRGGVSAWQEYGGEWAAACDGHGPMAARERRGVATARATRGARLRGADGGAAQGAGSMACGPADRGLPRCPGPAGRGTAAGRGAVRDVARVGANTWRQRTVPLDLTWFKCVLLQIFQQKWAE
jgi:hypothetical protein